MRALVAAGLLCACGSDGYGSSPGSSGTQISWPFTLGEAPECLSRPVPREEGVAVCRILVELADDTACPEASGWSDPLSGSEPKPRLRSTESGRRRTCEIRQLEGLALEACRTSEDCAECEPGWCVTDLPTLLANCPDSEPFPFRFTGGSSEVLPGDAMITCLRFAEQ